ncbi:amino acid synthesis family protein [Leucobacter denitrificans]|uniref:amino acid synthesis family protein n=1 Tax=Leucobacter denitrificans TaxID=683042 RepID=UPI0036161ABF
MDASTLVQVRKRALTVETIYHEFGPRSETPVRMVAATAVVANPYTGSFVEDLNPFMEALRPLAEEMSQEMVKALGGSDNVESYGKAAIVGTAGEIEHGAVWHVAGGWGMRHVLQEALSMVPSAKAVAATGYRLMVPMHHVSASYVRSHYSGMEIGIQDAPRPNEILFSLVMADGGRINSRLGGLTANEISVHDGQR